MKRRILACIKKWEGRGYPNGIPDEAPPPLERLNKVLTYRMICMAIMKNDVALTSLGFVRRPCAAYTTLKRIELVERGVIKPSRQMEIGFA